MVYKSLSNLLVFMVILAAPVLAQDEKEEVKAEKLARPAFESEIGRAHV